MTPAEAAAFLANDRLDGSSPTDDSPEVIEQLVQALNAAIERDPIERASFGLEPLEPEAAAPDGPEPDATAPAAPPPPASDHPDAIMAAGPPPDPWFSWASHVAAEPVSWLWPGRIPLGKLTLLDGDPGLGKSTLLLDVADRLSTGRPMPDASAPAPSDAHLPPSTVVLLSAEDGRSDTIRPRLEAAGANLRRVLILNRMPSHTYAGPLRIPDDLPFLESLIRRLDARLVIVDPLVAYLPRTINPHRDQDVRRALHPLAYRAERTGAAVVAARHLSKQASRNPLYRGGGSIGLIGAARSGLLVVADPDDPTGARRVLVSAKLNLGPPPPALAYRLLPAPNGVAVVSWEGATHHTAAGILAEAARDQGARAALDEAKAVLRTILAEGPVPTQLVRQQATRAGLGPNLLWRAKLTLGVRSVKLGGRGQSGQSWVWKLPESPQPATSKDEDHDTLPSESS